MARLYYTGLGSRRYRRASTQNGPGEPLCFKSTAEAALARQAAMHAEMRAIGAQLANVAFNLAQKPGHALTSDDVLLLDKLRRQWDAVSSRPNVGAKATTAAQTNDPERHNLSAAVGRP